MSTKWAFDHKTLKAIYHAILESHLYYYSLFWAQNFLALEEGLVKVI